jgi:arylsulfatase
MASDGTGRHPRTRGRLLVVALVVLAAILVTVGHRIDHPDRPSIVFILIDTLRADYLGTYGFEGDVSPHLDALARESVVFEHCYSQAPWTKPAIASLFTSLHPAAHGVLSHQGKYGRRAASVTRTDALSDEATTLAEVLQEAGYVTAAFVANPWILPDQGFAQGFDYFDGEGASNFTNADVVLAAARAWLATRPPDRPFFLYLHFMDVHGPYDAPDEDFLAVRESPSLGPPHTLTEGEIARFRAYLGRVPWAGRTGSRERRSWRGRYAAGIRAFDRRLAPFLDELRTSGTLDQIALVVTADHGEEICDHHGWDHGYTLHEHQLHVPLLVRLPGPVRHPRRVQEPVALIDLMPTLLALAGTRTPAGLHGHDISPLLEHRPESDVPRPLLASAVKWQPTQHALRRWPYKLIATLPAGPTSLYDVERDPGEQHDLAAAEPELVRELWRELERYLASPAMQPHFASAQVDVPPDLEERLKELGYVER